MIDHEQMDGRVGVGELRGLLIGMARTRPTVSYGEVAAHFEVPWSLKFGSSLVRRLNELGSENRQAGEPLLMSLVVNAKTQRPGGGFFQSAGATHASEAEQHAFVTHHAERCFAHAWPSPD